MFERYTETARRSIFFARYEASQFGSSTIETEHLLLGVLREDRSLATRFLGDQAMEGQGEISVPPEIAEAQQRIQSLVGNMERAIADHEFERARFYSGEERREREALRQLCEQHGFPETAGVPGGSVEMIRRRIESATQRRAKVSTSVDLPLSHESKRALAYGAEEAMRLNHEHIGPQHLFVGLLRVEKSLAAHVLREHGVDLAKVRTAISSGPAPIETKRGRAGKVGQMFQAMFGGPRGATWSPAWMSAQPETGRVLYLARHEAEQSEAACIETTHLLLALAHEKEVADHLPGGASSIRDRMKPGAKPREKVSAADLPFSEDCKRVFACAAEEAAQFGQRTTAIHLLLGILRLENCAAADILRESGMNAAGIRAKLVTPPPDPEQGRKHV